MGRQPRRQVRPRARGESGPVRVGVVGVGYLGRFHAEKYAAMADVDLVAVVDPDVDRAHEVAGHCGCEACRTPEEVYGRVDAVSVVVPTSLHHRVARGFLRRQVDVLVEKPIATTLPEASDLIRTARRNGCILQVGHLERFNAVWDAADRALNGPKFVEAHRLGPFQERGTDVDVILDLMIHDIDIVLKYMPSPVRRVDAVGVPVLSSNVDIANVRLHFGDGAVANFTASRVSGKRTRKIRFFQPDVYVAVDFDAGKTLVLRRVVSGDGEKPEIVGEELGVGTGDALRAELEAFVRSVRTREPPEVGGEEGRKALSVALRILRGMRSS